MLYCPNAFRNFYTFYGAPIEPTIFYFLYTFWNKDFTEMSQISEKLVSSQCLIIACTLTSVHNSLSVKLSKIFSVCKCIFTYFLKCTRKHDLFNLTTTKTFFSNAFHTVGNYNAFETLTAKKRLCFENFQS